MLTKEHILQKLRALKPALQAQFGLEAIGLFGSYARDEQRPGSDVDIIIGLSTPSFRTYCRVSDLVQQAFPEVRVETVSRPAIKPAYFERLKGDILYA